MANITNIIGGQPYTGGTATPPSDNKKNNLLNFWKGVQSSYDILEQTGATTATNPGSSATVDFTVTSSASFAVGDIVYVTGTAPGNTTRTQGTVDSIPDAVSIVIAFSPSYTSGATTGYTIDLYDPKTLYIITA
tara:strand:- start:1438 stop:1839 length:402 start_codon:yes stop_codon:yes gene_type:complete